jgi:hypothetical protein
VTDLPQLRVAADHGCHAVWVRLPRGGLDNVAAGEVGAPAALDAALDRWAEVYGQTLDRADPAASGFGTALEHELFVRWGHALAVALAAVVGEEVEYFDDRQRRAVVVRPDALSTG